MARLSKVRKTKDKLDSKFEGWSKLPKKQKWNLRIIKKYAAIYPTVKIQVTAIATPPTTSSTPKIQHLKKMF